MNHFKKLLAKRTVKTLILSFAIYILITLIFHYFSFAHPTPKPDLTHWKSLTVGLWSNAIFAGTFGLLAAIVSLIKPEEDTLDKRIGYLYPRSSMLTGDARTALGKHAMKLAAPAISGSIHFVVDSFDAQKKAFVVYGYVSFTLKNILQDETYRDDEVEIHVAPDEVDGVDVLGTLLESSVVCGECTPPRVVHAEAIPISAAEKRFQRFVTISIPPKAEAVHSYSFRVWALQTEKFTFMAQRYSEGITVQVTNRCGSQVTCSLTKGTNNPVGTPDALAEATITDGKTALLKNDIALLANRDRLHLTIAT